MNNLALRSRVTDELEFEPSIDAAHIGVAVESGVVTLTGYVATLAAKMAAEAAARRVKGVRAVADEIVVRPPGHKENADDEIARRALDILRWDAVVPAGAIEVTVADGWITLGGQVEWQFQRRAAEEAVRKLSGVIGVVNGLTIAPLLKPADVKGKIEAALRRRAEIEARNITVTVRDGGFVVLDGTVDNWDERQAVAAAAWSAPGVRSVEDHLKVVP
ncbi:MAG: BON domain-containing protein [Bauldia sp.]|nr:BON domain-containing protein [Bauldia sp.]MCW5717542.1 BON domain-containing protein [Bauldia sp.]